MMHSIENLVHDFENTVVGTFRLFEACRTLGLQRKVGHSTGNAAAGRATVAARADDCAAHSRYRESSRQTWSCLEANQEELSRQG